MKGALEGFWRSRPERERRFVAAGAALLAIALAYAYAWLPVARERDRLAVSVPELRMAARAMERDAQEIARLNAVAHPAARDIKSVLEQSAAATGMRPALAEVAAQGEGRARATLPSVRAAQWLPWIARLQSEHGIRLESARMQRVGDGDAVKVEAVFASTR